MATLILRTTCTTSRGDGADPLREDDASARRFAAGSGVDGIARGIPWTTTAASSTLGDHSAPVTFGPAGFHQLYRNPTADDAHPPPRGQSGASDVDVLASHPLQCDVALVPRVPLDDAESTTNAGRRLHSLRLTKQPFLPCGRSNFISVEELPPAGGGGEGGAHLLSLSNCIVEVAAGVGGNEPALVLPVAASPSTFTLSFREEGGGASSWGDAVHVVGGGVHRMGEAAVAFDFAEAMDSYRERIGKREKEAECPSAASVGGQYGQWTGATPNATAPQPEGRSEVASIMQNLEDESRFIRRTLAALGCAGVVFLGALGWTLVKMSKGKQKRRRRVRVASDAWRHGVPMEIGAVVGAADATPGEERPVRHRHVQVTPDVSPLQPPNIVDHRGRDVQLQFPDISPVQLSSHDGRAGLRLVTPRTPPPSPLSAVGDVLATDEVEKASPRNWYEDFLSPPAKNAAKKDDERCVNTLSFTKKEDIAHALYSPLKTTAKKDAKKDASARTKLNFDTPMARLSALAPPPSAVNLVTLSRRIESSVSFDEESSLDRASREGDDVSDLPAGQASFEEELRSVVSELSKRSDDGVAATPAQPQDRETAFEDEQRSVETVSVATIDRGLLSDTLELNNLLDDADVSVSNPFDETAITADITADTSALNEVTVHAVGSGSFLSTTSPGAMEDVGEKAEATPEVASSIASNATDTEASPSLLPELDVAADDVSVEADAKELSAEEEKEPSADLVEEDAATVKSLSTVSVDLGGYSSTASSEILLTPERSSDDSAQILEEEIDEAGIDETGGTDENEDESLVSPPKLAKKVDQYPFGFLEELTAATQGMRAHSPTDSSDAQRASEVSTPASAVKGVAALDVASASKTATKTPKKRMLTPSDLSTPDGSNDDSSGNEFLSDYWQA